MCNQWVMVMIQPTKCVRFIMITDRISNGVNQQWSINPTGFQERRSQRGINWNGRHKVRRNEYLWHKAFPSTSSVDEGSKAIWRRLRLQPVLLKPVTDDGRWATGVLQVLLRLRLTLPITCSAPPETHSLQLWQAARKWHTFATITKVLEVLITSKVWIKKCTMAIAANRPKTKLWEEVRKKRQSVQAKRRTGVNIRLDFKADTQQDARWMQS